jgi:hypothetical protein
METDPNAKLPQNAEQRESLTTVLVQSEHVKTLVKECAEELSSVNADIKQELVNHGSLPEFENALEKSEAVEGKAQEASEKLSVVNLALKDEIKERHVLEGKWATVTEQGKVDLRAALHDPLTGLPNRALFYDRLEHGFHHAKRHGCPTCGAAVGKGCVLYSDGLRSVPHPVRELSAIAAIERKLAHGSPLRNFQF